MKNPSNPGGADLGPKTDWAKWRANRDKRLREPRRLKTVKPSEEPSPTASTATQTFPEET